MIPPVDPASGKRGAWWQRKRARELGIVACFLLPSLAIFFLYRVLPLGWNLLLSLQYWSPLKPPRWAGLDHYEEMLLYDDVFWQALKNTLIFIGASPFAIALALGIALLVNSDLTGAAVYRSIVFLSYPLMTVAVGIIWRWMYDERGGIINFALRESGLIAKPIPFLQSFEWALPSVIVAEVWQVLGFYMIIILTGLQSIPQHLYEAASIDGAPRWAQFWRITLPMLKPSLFLCAVVGILNSFTSFDLVYIMTNGGPGHATELLITHIYKSGFGQTKFDYAAALTVVQFILLLALTYLANRAAGGNAGSLERQ
jgi:ABC-type sugar transport system permease subunit